MNAFYINASSLDVVEACLVGVHLNRRPGYALEARAASGLEQEVKRPGGSLLKNNKFLIS
jgi:hypothetical protein